MKKIAGFRRGYYIKIVDGFYEVIEGHKVVYFGGCRKNSTIQEIANKTILLNQEEVNDRARAKGYVRPSAKERYRNRSKDYDEQNVVGL